MSNAGSAGKSPALQEPASAEKAPAPNAAPAADATPAPSAKVNANAVPLTGKWLALESPETCYSDFVREEWERAGSGDETKRDQNLLDQDRRYLQRERDCRSGNGQACMALAEPQSEVFYRQSMIVDGEPILDCRGFFLDAACHATSGSTAEYCAASGAERFVAGDIDRARSALEKGCAAKDAASCGLGELTKQRPLTQEAVEEWAKAHQELARRLLVAASSTTATEERSPLLFAVIRALGHQGDMQATLLTTVYSVDALEAFGARFAPQCQKDPESCWKTLLPDALNDYVAYALCLSGSGPACRLFALLHRGGGTSTDEEKKAARIFEKTMQQACSAGDKYSCALFAVTSGEKGGLWGKDDAEAVRLLESSCKDGDCLELLDSGEHPIPQGLFPWTFVDERFELLAAAACVIGGKGCGRLDDEGVDLPVADVTLRACLNGHLASCDKQFFAQPETPDFNEKNMTAACRRPGKLDYPKQVARCAIAYLIGSGPKDVIQKLCDSGALLCLRAISSFDTTKEQLPFAEAACTAGNSEACRFMAREYSYGAKADFAKAGQFQDDADRAEEYERAPAAPSWVKRKGARAQDEGR